MRRIHIVDGLAREADASITFTPDPTGSGRDDPRRVRAACRIHLVDEVFTPDLHGLGTTGAPEGSSRGVRRIHIVDGLALHVRHEAARLIASSCLASNGLSQAQGGGR